MKKLYSQLLRIIGILLLPFSWAGPLRQWLRYKIALLSVHNPRPDDIFIASFPKSGTTLMQMMLYQLTSDGDMDISHINSVCPWFEYEYMNYRSEGTRKLFDELPSPRIFKSHLTWQDLPRQGRFIYVARGIRDVMVSAYHHRCLYSGRVPDRDRFMKLFLRPPVPIALTSWFKHLESWWPHRNDENVLFLTYEGILEDLEGSVRKVATFCNIELDPDDLPRILERCSIGFMKQYWDKFDPRLHRSSPTRAEFIRQGVAGAGRRELTPEQEELASRSLRALATKLGYAPGDPYRELFV